MTGGIMPAAAPAWSLAAHLWGLAEGWRRRARDLSAENERLRRRAAALESDNARLRDRLGELERSAALDSENSSKPPSSDGLRKAGPGEKRTASLRRRSGRKPGGQAGRAGHTLRQVQKPDAVVDHYPVHCGRCGARGVSRETDSYIRRQVFDLPAPAPLQVVEHRAHHGICSACERRTRALFPQRVKAPVQYGERLSAYVSYLHHAQFIPLERAAQACRDLFGVSLSSGTAAAMCRRAGERMLPLAHTIGEAVRVRAPLKHLDETGLRVAAALRWVHVRSTRLLTALPLGQSRGDIGTAVHDDCSSYARLEGVTHASCNAHHLRERAAAEQLDGERRAGRQCRLLERAWRLQSRAQQRGTAVDAGKIQLCSRLWDRILADAIAFHEAQAPLHTGRRGRKKRRKGHNLALRLARSKEACLLFLEDPAVPFSNHQAETDFRFVRLMQKIFGGFRTEHGARHHLAMRAVISTARKQGWNLMDVIMHPDPARLKDRLRWQDRRSPRRHSRRRPPPQQLQALRHSSMPLQAAPYNSGYSIPEQLQFA